MRPLLMSGNLNDKYPKDIVAYGDGQDNVKRFLRNEAADSKCHVPE